MESKIKVLITVLVMEMAQIQKQSPQQCFLASQHKAFHLPDFISHNLVSVLSAHILFINYIKRARYETCSAKLSYLSNTVKQLSLKGI